MQKLAARTVYDTENLFKTVVSSVIRIGDITCTVGVQIAEEADLVAMISGRIKPEDIAKVLTIHRVDIIKRLQVGAPEHTSLLAVQRYAVCFGRFAHTTVRGIANMPCPGACRFNIKASTKTRLLDLVSEHTFCQWASADIAQTHELDTDRLATFACHGLYTSDYETNDSGMTSGGKIHRDATDMENRRVWSVADLTSEIHQTLKQRFSDVWVEGEVSNARLHSSGHTYLTLKDSSSQLKCVLWRSAAWRVQVKPVDGMLLHVRGYLSVYEARGDYQLIIQQIRPAGEGALQKAFEALKRKLAAAGLFDEGLKRKLPRFPRSIGLVTSADGAAMRDITTVLARRYPLVRVYLHPVAVQGAPAAGQIAAAIDAFDRSANVDLLIVGRGGGSTEDLWPFNEEVVARAVHRCRIPIISAVGHETDFSIADFVADVRAATPSIAAELAVPDQRELIREIEKRIDRGRLRLRDLFTARRRRILAIVGSHGFNRPVSRLRELQQRRDELESRLFIGMNHLIERRKMLAENGRVRLEALNPGAPLERGFVMVERSGERIRKTTQVDSGDRVRMRFSDGHLDADVV